MNITLNKLDWSKVKEKVPDKLDPALVNWKGKTLFYGDREVVMDVKRKREILIELYEGIDTPYGINALQRVISQKFIGITQKDLREFLHGHESF